MAVAYDGTLSCTEFYTAAATFTQLWNKFNSSLPPWLWVPSPKLPWQSYNQEDGYLSMENVTLSTFNQEDCDRLEKEESSSVDEVEFVDKATLVQSNGGDHCYDFHVVYSASYKVPVLYFRAYCSGGQPLVLDDIENDIPVDSAHLLTRSKWTFITQEEHPYLNRPWYMLHPCATGEWMKLLLLNEHVVVTQSRVEKYLVSWFSVVGQVFGLKIPPCMLDNSSVASLQNNTMDAKTCSRTDENSYVLCMK